MKLSGSQAEAFARKPDPKIACALLYGPDRGLVRERAEAMVRAVAGGLRDPFRVAEMQGADVIREPARFADEVGALSLFGGSRVVRVREAGDGVAVTIDDFLRSAGAGVLVVVEAGELGSRSALRRVCEGAANAVAIGCYGDDERSLRAVIGGGLRAAGLGIDEEALSFLAANLGSDRELTRREIEKLVLYKGGPGTVSLEDALACTADGGASSLEGVAYACADGDLGSLERLLDRGFQEGASPVTVLRATARHLMRLHQAAALLAAGRSAEQAMASLRPPVIFRREAAFRRQLDGWDRRSIGAVLQALTEAELACKTTGAPARTICEKALLDIARSKAAGGERA